MGNIPIGDVLALIGSRDNNGFGGGDGALWLIIFLVLIGGWGGNRGWGNQGGQGGAGGIGGNELYPWINQTETVNAGFRDQMFQTGLTGLQQSVTGGFSGIQQALCSGFAGVNSGMASGFSQTQLAMLQGFNGLQAQQAQCCCDNQLAMANQTAALLAEHCADRNALNQAVNTLVANQTAGFQSIKDQLCQDKIDEKNDQIAMLRQQVQMQNLAASQSAQTAQILADNFAQTSALEQYLAPVPRPAYVVQNPNCCTQNFGCGCAA